jgi:quercetin 2,3-dioxygenase
MLFVRKSSDRGHADHGWLKSYHTFSFADYFDPKFMGFRSLRVINEDFVNPGQGFPTHGHKDMEIISYVVSGALEHKDSMGNGSIIRPGEVQYMSAGSGVRHSEYNPSDELKVHLLQIWIMPSKKSQTPRYDQKSFSPEVLENRLCLIVQSDDSENANSGAIAIRQDANVYASRLDKDRTLEFKPSQNRGVWVQMVRGRMDINGEHLSSGDALAADNEAILKIKALEPSEFLLFDLA